MDIVDYIAIVVAILSGFYLILTLISKHKFDVWAMNTGIWCLIYLMK